MKRFQAAWNVWLVALLILLLWARRRVAEATLRGNRIQRRQSHRRKEQSAGFWIRCTALFYPNEVDAAQFSLRELQSRQKCPDINPYSFTLNSTSQSFHLVHVQESYSAGTIYNLTIFLLQATTSQCLGAFSVKVSVYITGKMSVVHWGNQISCDVAEAMVVDSSSVIELKLAQVPYQCLLYESEIMTNAQSWCQTDVEDPSVVIAAQFAVHELVKQQCLIEDRNPYSFLVNDREQFYRIVQAWQQQVGTSKNIKIDILFEHSNYRGCAGAFSAIVNDQLGTLSVVDWGGEMNCKMFEGHGGVAFDIQQSEGTQNNIPFSCSHNVSEVAPCDGDWCLSRLDDPAVEKAATLALNELVAQQQNSKNQFRFTIDYATQSYLIINARKQAYGMQYNPTILIRNLVTGCCVGAISPTVGNPLDENVGIQNGETKVATNSAVFGQEMTRSCEVIDWGDEINCDIAEKMAAPIYDNPFCRFEPGFGVYRTV